MKYIACRRFTGASQPSKVRVWPAVRTIPTPPAAPAYRPGTQPGGRPGIFCRSRRRPQRPSGAGRHAGALFRPRGRNIHHTVCPVPLPGAFRLAAGTTRVRRARFQTWRAVKNPQGMTLVYAWAYLNSPASMYGHTMLPTAFSLRQLRFSAGCPRTVWNCPIVRSDYWQGAHAFI